MMKTLRIVCLGMVLSLAGCVMGGGRCLWLEPLKSTVSGTLHFRPFKGTEGVDQVPVLALDKTAYIYAPGISHQCQSAEELQLVGVAEFAPNIAENSHIRVQGALFGAVSGHQHTPFLVNVSNIELIKPVLPTRAVPAPGPGIAH